MNMAAYDFLHSSPLEERQRTQAELERSGLISGLISVIFVHLRRRGSLQPLSPQEHAELKLKNDFWNDYFKQQLDAIAALRDRVGAKLAITHVAIDQAIESLKEMEAFMRAQGDELSTAKADKLHQEHEALEEFRDDFVDPSLERIQNENPPMSEAELRDTEERLDNGIERFASLRKYFSENKDYVMGKFTNWKNSIFGTTMPAPPYSSGESDDDDDETEDEGIAFRPHDPDTEPA